MEGIGPQNGPVASAVAALVLLSAPGCDIRGTPPATIPTVLCGRAPSAESNRSLLA